MVTIPIWATTLMVQNETAYIHIYMKLKSIFSNANKYFAVLIHFVYILCIYIYIYIYIYKYIHYILYYNTHIIHIYISSRVFPTGE